jgi:hypothetical protein
LNLEVVTKLGLLNKCLVVLIREEVNLQLIENKCC